jgi:hypothetical protein
MAPVASTWRWKGRERSGWWREGLESTMPINWSSACVHSLVQMKGWSFFVRAIRGHTTLAKLGMKGCW